MKLVATKDVKVGGLYCVYETTRTCGNIYKKLNHVKVNELVDHFPEDDARSNIIGGVCSVYRRDTMVRNREDKFTFWFNSNGVDSYWYELDDDEVGQIVMDLV